MAHKSPEHFSDLPLRERKRARTRLALLDALLAQIGPRRIEQVPVKELCAGAEISEVTFFKHFPAKTDLLAYFIELWGIELAWHADQVARAQGSALRGIGEIFERMARDSERNIDLMLEVIAHQARRPQKPVVPGVSTAERLLRFPDLAGIEAFPFAGLETVLSHFLRAAIRDGELPPSSDGASLALVLLSLLFGVPLSAGRHDPAAIAPLYRQQLRLVWAGARNRGSLDGGLNAEPGFFRSP